MRKNMAPSFGVSGMGRRRRKESQADKQSLQSQAHTAPEEGQIATLPLQTVPVSLSLPHDDLHQDTQIVHGGTLATYNDADAGPAGDTQLLPDDAADGVHGDAKGQDLEGTGSPLYCNLNPLMLADGANDQIPSIDNDEVPDSDATTEEGNGPENADKEDEKCCAESARIDDDATRSDGLGGIHAEKAHDGGFVDAKDGGDPTPRSAAAIRAASLRISGLRSAARNSSNSRVDALTKDGFHATVEPPPGMVVGPLQVQNRFKEQPSAVANINDSPNNYIVPDGDSETTVEVNSQTIKPSDLEDTNFVENASDSMPNPFLKKPTCQTFASEEERAAAAILNPAGEDKHGSDKLIKYARNIRTRKPHFSSQKLSPDVVPEVPKTDTEEFGKNLTLNEQTGVKGIDDALQQTGGAYQASGGGGPKAPGTLASAKLSYADSLEPGDETQLDALNMVEKLVSLNTSGLSLDVGTNILPEHSISQVNKGTNGFQSLAHTAEVKSMQDKMGIYEYPDSQMLDSNPLPDVKVARNSRASKGGRRKSGSEVEKVSSDLRTVYRTKGAAASKIAARTETDSNPLPGVKVERDSRASKVRKRKTGSNAEKVSLDLRTVNRTKGAAASNIAARTETATTDRKLSRIAAEPHTLLTTRLKESSRKRKGVKGEENGSRSDTVPKKRASKSTASEDSSRSIGDQASLASTLIKKLQPRESVVQKDEKEFLKPSKTTTKTDAAERKDAVCTEAASRDLKSPTDRVEPHALLTRRLKERTMKGKGVVEKEGNASRLRDLPERRAGKRKTTEDSPPGKDQAITSGEKDSPKLHVTSEDTNEAADSLTAANDALIESGDDQKWRDKAGNQKFADRRATRNRVHEGLGSKSKARKQSSLEEDTRLGAKRLKGASNSARGKTQTGSSGRCDAKESKLETEVEERKGNDLLTANTGANTGTKHGLKARMTNWKASEDFARKGSKVDSDILDGPSADVTVTSAQKLKHDNRRLAMPRKEKVTREKRKPTLSKLDSSPLVVEGRRKKRDTGCIWVLLSHSLPEDTKKQQQKLLAKLGGHLVSSAAESSHFVANGFVRTRNMLESIATGKPVVTPQWLESCLQAHYVVDEKKYILQDAKKEKEIGFSMHSSLAAAQRRPLLKGVNVLVSPNTTPDVKSMTSIVRSAGGVVVQSIQKFGKLDVAANNILVADEKDIEFCRPLLERGFKAYSAELVLNGIVVQNLDFSRYQIFEEYQK